MSRITRYPDYDVLASAIAGGDAATIALANSMRIAYRDRCAEKGTKMILDFKSPFAHADTAPAVSKVYKNQIPEMGDATQTQASFTRVYNLAGKLIGVKLNNQIAMRMTFPTSCKLPQNTVRSGIVVWVTVNNADAAGTRSLLGWGDGTLATQRAASLILSGANALAIGMGGSSSSAVPLVTMGTVYQVAAELEIDLTTPTNSKHRIFANGAQVGTDAIVDGTAGLAQPAAAFGIGGFTGYYSTVNANYTVHRVIVEDLAASGRTMAQLVALDYKRNATRFLP